MDGVALDADITVSAVGLFVDRHEPFGDAFDEFALKDTFDFVVVACFGKSFVEKGKGVFFTVLVIDHLPRVCGVLGTSGCA